MRREGTRRRAEILKWLNGDYAGDNEDFPA